MKKFVRMAIATMGVMFVANWLAAQNSTARKFIKGSVVTGTGSVGNNSGNVVSL